MRKGDKVRFVKHHEGYKEDNEQNRLKIGEIYIVEGLNAIDGTPYINNGCAVFYDEVELIKDTDGLTWKNIKAQYPLTPSKAFKLDQHYNNTNGSLYKFAQDHELNAYEFDCIKRIVRCRKKGQFKEDLEKTKRVIDLYLKEFEVL
jgi:hypothetical protein